MKRLGVGIVGLEPGVSWAATAHIPALRALPNDFEIVGVANRSEASARAAAEACGLPRGFPSVAALCADPAVDVVAVNVKVPHHADVVRAAIQARKPIYCEWPLGNGLAEAKALEQEAREAGVLGVIGTQARGSIELAHVASLVRDGYVGRLLSVAIVATGTPGAPEIRARGVYSMDKRNGATLLTLNVGHMLAALRDFVGPVQEVSARLFVRRPTAKVTETGEQVEKTAPDQVLAHAVLADGAPLSLHYRSWSGPASEGLFWQIQGQEGVIQITSPGHVQYAPLSIRGGRGDEPLKELSTPPELLAGWPENLVARNIARLYAQMATDLRTGSRDAPSFADAVEIQKVVAAIEAAAESGGRVAVAG